ncbi:unnamed protein product [Rotaria sordida]|uniref:RING-type domain-containing protein n=1 Tax=Rotaria sordida TaxID=392033 RepID=A0A814G9I0_9BILA|nr:unnamed protein product [Rotaria sordida]CAF0994894.1 unnamed protein product [Rotaria sordida]
MQSAITSLNESDNDNKQIFQSSSYSTSQQGSTNSDTLCIVCSTRNRALAFVPCGHFSVCVPCGHGLVACPICGTNIKALFKVYS